MARISLKDVNVRMPVYSASTRSIKKTIFSHATGGKIARNARNVPVIEALSDITIDIVSGDRVGLIGANGAGKSTLLRVMAQIYEPQKGSLVVEGSVVPLLSLNIGLSPDLTAKENFLLRALALGLDRQIIELMENNIRSFSELGEFFDLPIKTYSSGMTMRLALGMAIATEPEILLVDEWLMAGDASFLLKSKQRIEKFISGAKVLVLASHSEDIIREWCNKAILMKEGRILFSGNVNDAFKIYDQISTID